MHLTEGVYQSQLPLGTIFFLKYVYKFVSLKTQVDIISLSCIKLNTAVSNKESRISSLSP